MSETESFEQPNTSATENFEQPNTSTPIHMINQEYTIDEVLLSQNKEDELNAKLKELEQWKSRNVYS